jgi:ribosomal-protein-alanine N-acetyltransferase
MTLALANDFEIRYAVPTDIDGVMKLEIQSFDIGIQEKESVFLRRIDCFSFGFLVLIDKSSDQMIGYVCAELWPYKEFVSKSSFALNHEISDHDENGSEIYISSMAIGRQYRNKGLGQYLFKECIERIRVAYPNVDSAILIVNETWASARKIYRKQDFHEIDKLNDFFYPAHKAPQAAIVMRRSF